MPAGGHTTVIQRILERRAARATVEETTATIAVMLRVLPPPRALLVCQDAVVREQLERRITADMLDYESLADARRIAELESVLRVTLAENRKLSATDDLTRVNSRRFFSKHFPREVERAARYGRALSLVLCDIDLFKSVNDTHGHACGDQVL